MRLFALLPPWTETAVILVGPIVAIVFLLALPFLAGTGEKSWRRRPMAVVSVLLIVLTVVTLAGLGITARWSPVMDAWAPCRRRKRMCRGGRPWAQGAW
jgi:ubiquinol-cytochrome c reductase cytochrome b subunit